MTTDQILTLGDGTTLTIAMDSDGVADFSVEKKPPIPFKVNGETYYFTATLPGGAMRLIGEIFKLDPGDQIIRITELLDSVLIEESRKRFAEKMLDPDEPIGIDQIGNIFTYIVSVCSGIRPTDPAPSSAAGLSAGGVSSTGTVQPSESTQMSLGLNDSPTLSTIS